MTDAQANALGLLAGLSLLTLLVFGRLLAKIRLNGGKVVQAFELPELLVSLVLGGFFVLLIAHSALRPGTEPLPKVTIDQVLSNAFLFIMIFGGIAAFLNHRGIALGEALGLWRISPGRTLLWSLGLIAAAFPIILLGNQLMQMLLSESAREQEVVTLFRDLARSGSRVVLAQVFLACAVVAPVCEEFLFRGFFYVVGKRYVGPVGSALATSALFAAFHNNLGALPSLFVLALCLTIAYEATGSLLVPVTMHALFNASELAYLYWTAHQLPPA